MFVLPSLNQTISGIIAALFVAAYVYHLKTVASLELTVANEKTKYASLLEATSIQGAEITRLSVMGQSYAAVIQSAVDKNATNNKMWADVIKWVQTEPIPSDCDGAFNHLKMRIKEIGSK